MVDTSHLLDDDVHCVSWRILPLLLLEGCLLLVTLWRITHHVYWKSHPRRVFFHLALLLACALRWVFWLTLCHRDTLMAVGIALLWCANSFLLLCTASVIVQWWVAVSVGRVAHRELQRAKKFSLHHPLVVLHVMHLLCSLGGGVDLIVYEPMSLDKLEHYESRAHTFLLVHRALNVVTVAIDAVVALLVARKLRARLLTAPMGEDLKTKSLIQLTLLIISITVSLLLEFVMDLPVLLVGLEDAFGTLTYAQFCVVQNLVPGALLSLAFLYIMRRVEQREPVRLAVMPSSSSLVDYEECPSPCMWCEHHRRYNVTHSKWDVTFMTSFSPRTVDSSFRSPLPPGATSYGHHHHHHHHHGMRGGLAMGMNDMNSMAIMNGDMEGGTIGVLTSDFDTFSSGHDPNETGDYDQHQHRHRHRHCQHAPHQNHNHHHADHPPPIA